MTYRHLSRHERRAAAQMTAIRKAQALLAAFLLECVLFAGILTMELCR